MNIFGFIKEKSKDERRALAKAIWPNMSDKAQEVSVSRLVNGGFKTVKISWVRSICERYNIDPNKLFGYPWHKKVTIKTKKKI